MRRLQARTGAIRFNVPHKLRDWRTGRFQIVLAKGLLDDLFAWRIQRKMASVATTFAIYQGHGRSILPKQLDQTKHRGSAETRFLAEVGNVGR
ncbi:hypothetical protein Jann_3005 [Jannaschia sp. CCS1]|nr:hypothetical protein Jann_3005 [Jannaschia sp. CCS1]